MVKATVRETGEPRKRRRRASSPQSGGLEIGTDPSDPASGNGSGGNIETGNTQEERPESGPGADSTDQGLEIVVKPTTRGPRKPRAKKVEEKKPEDFDLIASTLCASLSAVAVALTNRPEVVMNEVEQGFIKPPLVATLAAMDEETQERINKYANPIMVLAGLALWGLRVAGSMNQPKAKPASKPVVSTPSEVAPTPVSEDLTGIAVTIQDKIGIGATE